MLNIVLFYTFIIVAKHDLYAGQHIMLLCILVSLVCSSAL